jgi:hypothetical protein
VLVCLWWCAAVAVCLCLCAILHINPTYTLYKYTQYVHTCTLLLLQVGPLSINVDASTWHSYESGVYNGCDQVRLFKLLLLLLLLLMLLYLHIYTTIYITIYIYITNLYLTLPLPYLYHKYVFNPRPPPPHYHTQYPIPRHPLM